MPKEITQAILSKKEDIEKNGLDFDDVLEVKKITEKSYATGDEQISFELVMALSPNIYAEISENKAVIYGYWGSEEYREVIENENLYDYLVEMCY